MLSHRWISPAGEEDDDLILMDTIADDSVAVSELAADRIVLEQLFKRLADLMPEAADIEAYAGLFRMKQSPSPSAFSYKLFLVPELKCQETVREGISWLF